MAIIMAIIYNLTKLQFDRYFLEASSNAQLCEEEKS